MPKIMKPEVITEDLCMYDRQTIKHTTQNTSWPDPSKQAHMQWRENTPVHYVSGFNFSSKICNSSFWKLGFFLEKDRE